MKTLLICHAGDTLNEAGLARWLSSFSNLAGIVSISERPSRIWQRIRREIQRVGPARFFDVLAFRLHYQLIHASRDRLWEERLMDQLSKTYPKTGSALRILATSSPNSNEALEFIQSVKPDIMIARCKTLLKEGVFSLPNLGTFVMHPGICPEYRNAHGCFWALAKGDYERVGMTLLRVDKGIDTGAVYGYFNCDFDELTDSHTRIQHRTVFDNLDALQQKFEDIVAGRAQTIDTKGRASAAWGQPWLSSYLKWKWRARTTKTQRHKGGNAASMNQ